MDGLQDGFSWGFGCGCVGALFLIAGPVFYVIVTTPWLKCFLSGSEVSGLQILGMRLRGTPIDIVTDAQIALIHSGIRIHVGRVESAYLSEPARVRTSADLVHLVKWGLNEADPKPAWASDVAGLTMQQPPRAQARSLNSEP